MTDEKRAFLREDQMVSLRELYKDNGIHDAASFVLEGSSFTKDRVGDSYDGVHYPLEVYDAGAQIILNSFDWLIPANEGLRLSPPRLGTMAHSVWGLVILVLIIGALFSFDAYAGLSYLASLVAPDISPLSIHQEAYFLVHQGKNLPSPTTLKKSDGEMSSKWSDDDEGDMRDLMEDLDDRGEDTMEIMEVTS